MLTLKHRQTIRNQGSCKFHNFDIIYSPYFLCTTCIIVHFMCLFIYSSVNRQKTVDTDGSEGESKNSK